jgi:predicted unusual protein kinase regulating ubiquinone biosynthesis (AarF/ABC1/UbiB family)
MPIMSWIPLSLRELLRHVPTLLFEVVAWSDLFKEGKLLSKRLLNGEGAEEAREALKPLLPRGLKLTTTTSTVVTTANTRHMLGEKILELYFIQALGAEKVFLDMRSTGFGLSGDDFVWNPTGLWAQFTAEFRAGLKKLYHGFYLKDDESFQQGLLATGLVHADWPAADKEKMARLFRAHFASADCMEFRLDTFQKSFQSVFAFLLEKKVRLSTDFLLLGIMLVTLYMALEECGGEYEVARIYHEAWP